MTASDAQIAAQQFKAETGCVIDILATSGRVIAAGTNSGGCLDLALPEDTVPVTVQIGPFSMPLPAAIGGSAAALANAFGRPDVVRLGPDAVALIWPQGLVAHIARWRDGDGIVTYLAVVAPGSAAVPAIGHFTVP